MKKVLSFVLFLALFWTVGAHGGRLNGEWCHNDYKWKTYHCHDEDGNITSSRDLETEDEDDMDEDEDINVADLPASITEYISENYPSASIEEAELDDGIIEIELDSWVELEFSLDGELLAIEEDDEDEDEDDMGERDWIKKEQYKAKKTEVKEMRDASKEELKIMKEEGRDDIRENRGEAKENRKDFRMENKDELMEIKKGLLDDQKEELEELKKEFQEEMDELREEMKEADSDEERAEIHMEMKTLAQEKYEAVKEIVWSDETAQALLDKRKEVFKENQELREENREIRKEYKEVRRETVVAYRTAFVKRIGNALDNMSDEKLEQIAARIDTMIEDFEMKTGISESRRASMLAALMALKEIIDEKLETGDLEDDILETVESLLD